MILRLTAKLGEKVGLLPETRLPLDENPFADWTGHLFRAERVQYIIIANTPSLYSLVMYGRGVTDEHRHPRLIEIRRNGIRPGNHFGRSLRGAAV